MGEKKLNEYGMTPLTGKHYFVYGLGNFASQHLTMVSHILTLQITMALFREALRKTLAEY